MTRSARESPAGPVRVVITGGASGLGLSLAKLYCARAARVLVLDLAHQKPPQVPDHADYRQCDVRSQQDWDAALAWVRQEWAGVDLLYNNAGIAAGGRIDVEAMSEWERIVEINLLGVVRGCQTFVPMLKAQGHGRIVNTASLAGLVHPPGMASYSVTKAGVVALSETLRFELEPFGVAVSVICPAFFRSNLHTSFQSKDELLEKSGTRLITQARHSADQIAARVVAEVDKGTYLILPDGFARFAYWGKRFARPVYERSTRRLARATAAKSTKELR